jgi:hypothetical protein
MRWATRRGVHIDRASSAWLIGRFLDPEASFEFVDEVEDVSDGATPFDMRGADLSHHGSDCTFETILRRHELDDPALWAIAEIVHEADLGDERFDAAEAAGLDAIVRGLSMTLDDEAVLGATRPIFDGLYAFKQRALLLGREPA